MTAFLALPSPVARAAAPKLAQFLAHPLPWVRPSPFLGALISLTLTLTLDADDSSDSRRPTSSLAR